MNRIIKFRVWDILNEEMIYPNDKTNSWFLIKLNGEVVDGNGYKYDECYPVQQFTGLLDKNGKEIYEGDILLCYPDNTGLRHIEDNIYEADESLPKRPELDLVIYKGSVRYSEELCCFELKIVNHPRIAASQLSRTKYLYEIIGNVFENPDLMK